LFDVVISIQIRLPSPLFFSQTKTRVYRHISQEIYYGDNKYAGLQCYMVYHEITRLWTVTWLQGWLLQGYMVVIMGYMVILWLYSYSGRGYGVACRSFAISIISPLQYMTADSKKLIRLLVS